MSPPPIRKIAAPTPSRAERSGVRGRRTVGPMELAAKSEPGFTDPALAACGVIMFIISWHELLIPLILNARPDVMTLPVVIASLVGRLTPV